VADLHVHSCLSPCGELDMTPKRIMERAASLGIDMIAVSDHNSAENLLAAQEAAKRNGLAFLPAMEITSSEEAHVLAIFETSADALAMQEKVYRGLPEGRNDERLWGEQVLVNIDDEVLGFNTRLLIGATGMGIKKIVDEIHALGGLAIASHIDRESFSVLGQLGFFPEDVEFDALEIVSMGRIPAGLPASVPFVCSSDAHRLEDIGKLRTSFLLESPRFGELKMALKGEKGRRCISH
jgi:predicted metal-dependent phosphoesterase TrpH